MLTLAASATSTTIVYILIWGVLFPAFVTGLIVYALIVGRGEGQENEEHRRFSRRL
jgi:K+-transporting ATPase c subunit